MSAGQPPPQPELRRGIGLGGAILLTIGSIVGTGIFFTGDDIARVLPHEGLILLVWIAGGLLVLAGALTFAELGTAFPKAGGSYHYLKESYGPLWGFLYGWLALLVYMSGGIAAIATGFGDALGSLLPAFAGSQAVLTLPFGAGEGYTLHGNVLAAVLAIVALTAINHFGLGFGAGVNNGITLIKIGSIVAFTAAGFLVAAQAFPDFLAPLDQARALAAEQAASVGGAGGPAAGSLLAGFGVAMIAVLWTYDGWFGLTASAGELRQPERNLPRGLVIGVLITVGLYLGLNLMYFRAVPVAGMAEHANLGEYAAGTLLGQVAGRLFALAVVISSFGCLASTILYSSRIYVPMAQDGLFFPAVGRIHPRWRTPVASLWLQSGWAVLLALSGSYETLYTYAIFASLLIMFATGAAVFVLRKRQPELPRPYRVWGYPVMPLLFMAGVGALVINTVMDSPQESLFGLGLVVLGLPAYAWFRRGRAR
ncbi:MAG TPA: amino acid permease [Planctomycetota bacterium]|nr:amino acid permease [Planctomycetota bacterium]